MTTFNEEASVLVEGVEFPCRANLRSGHNRVPDPVSGGSLEGLAWWRGTLRVQDDNAFWVISDADDPRLRINGREASFRPVGGQSGTLRIEGNGAPPF